MRAMAKLLVLHHYYHPDDAPILYMGMGTTKSNASTCSLGTGVAGSIIFTGLCEDLASKSWTVEIWPANRSCHHYDARYPLKKETINGVTVRRVWRPPFRQHSFIGRIINTIWMLKFWWLRLALSPKYRPDVILTGTDPIFSIILVPWLRLLRPKARIVHWCFDLYPEYAAAEGMIKDNGLVVKILEPFLRFSYKFCDLVVDLGSCMKQKLERYSVKKTLTLTPWAQEEPAQSMSFDMKERVELFGNSHLGLLYSGNFGRLHEFYNTLKLARLMKTKGSTSKPTAVFTYGVRGSRLAGLKLAVNPEDTNVRFADFAPPDRLATRLSAPDIHLVSLRPEATGVAVPSKFFGALAVGRPVLFEGAVTSCIARWIKEYQVGWVLGHDNLEETAKELLAFSKNPEIKAAMFRHCHTVYQAKFSKRAILAQWDKELRTLLV